MNQTTNTVEVDGGWADDFFGEGYREMFDALGKYESTERDVDDLVRLLGLAPGARVLDVPCGYGRHAALLAERGMAVTGVDVSPVQIEHARRRAPEVDFAVGDMRTPPGHGYDAALNLWTSFGYLEHPSDDFAALRAWHTALGPGGKLLMEITHLERAERENRHGDEALGHKIVERYGVVEESSFDWTKQLCHSRYTFRGQTRACRTRMYSQHQLVGLLGDAGFADVRCYGDFTGGPVRVENRLVLVATKPDA